MSTTPLRSVLQAAERGEDPAIILRNALSLVEQTAHDLARLTRGVTTATPERRALREAFEAALNDFIKGTATPDGAVTYTMPEATLVRLLSQSPTAQAKAAAPDQAEGQTDVG